MEIQQSGIRLIPIPAFLLSLFNFGFCVIRVFRGSVLDAGCLLLDTGFTG
jgi:hypothetical protein